MSDADVRAARLRHARVSALFDEALELPPGARDALLLSAAADDDAAVVNDVRALLSAHEQLDGFLEQPAPGDMMLQSLRDALADRYTLRERIAQGGMATVYRADDLRHGRSVAIKVLALPTTAVSAGTPALQQRFLDEIRVTARLQHANVMPLFDSGTAGGQLYYVMPFVDGETVRARLRRTGPLPLDEALQLARGIGAALEHAHASSIVHRDLKPENILLRDDQPLVCDFGIALATATLDTTRLTQSGVVIGTPQYMSPEQASGAPLIDARTDVYALAAIVYEMLVGDPPHVASTSQGVLAKVRVERPTSVHLLRDGVPVAVSVEIDRALSKVPADRHPSAKAFVSALEAARQAPHASRAASPRRILSSTRMALLVGSVLLLAIVVPVLRRTTAPTPAAATAARFVVTPIPDAAVGRAPTITPDGSALVYAGSAVSGRQIFVRRIDQLDAAPVAGTRGALNTWVSPNGQQVAFTTSDDRIAVVGLDGTNRRDLAGVFRYSEATWINDSVLAVAGFGNAGLSWIRATGGASYPLTRRDTLRRDAVHELPVALGDGRSVVFLALRGRAGPGLQTGELSLVQLDERTTRESGYTPLGVLAAQPVAYLDGWLLYVAIDARTLMAVRLDLASRAVRGEPVPVLTQDGGGIERVRLASNGTLIYSRRVLPRNTPVLVDTTGVATPVVAGLRGSFMNPRVSPDGRRLLVQGASAPGSDAWVYDIGSGTRMQLTRSGAVLGPAWTDDGQRVVYASPGDGQDALWSLPVDGRGDATRIVAVSGAFAAAPSRRGDVLLFQRRTSGVWSIWQAPAIAGAAPTAIVSGRFDAFMPALSPDGRWLAYASSESGRYEIFVRPFPGPGMATQVSTDGGTEPVWAPDGHRIFFRGDQRMQAATITLGATPVITARRVLFTDVFDGDMPMPHRNYDIMPDGRRFVMIAAADDAAPETIVVLDWTTELRTRLAAARR
ncbi:MAG TPA: protein kinase [Gemmatimonadaceae bacterium]|nr:protein kinase [Gemmatimonadaceae bacterium]